MDILCIQPYKGRNIYSHKPVIKASIDLENLFDTPSNQINRFNEGLLQILPGLGKHHCSLGYEGGFLERLREGTYLAHVTEHVVLELQTLMGYGVHYGQSRGTQRPSVYCIVFEYKNEKLAIECLLAAVELVNTLIAGKPPQIDSILTYLERVAAQSELGTSTNAIFMEACKRKIPVTCLEDSGILQLGNGKYTRLIEASLTDEASCVAVDIAGNKHLTKQILYEAGIMVPKGDVAYTIKSARTIATYIGYPVAVKPFDANQGKGVSTNIANDRELEEAYHTAAKYSHAMIVEKHIPGKDYRLLVVGGKMVAAAERRPPFVVGNGTMSIRQLIDSENKDPLRGADHEKPLTTIKMDDMSRQVLAKEGYDENSIPRQGEIVKLRNNGNLSTGGTASDCTEQVHPYNMQLAADAAALMGLDVAGIDITCKDISKPLTYDNGAVIEVNAAPGLRMHIYPTEGKARNVAADILDLMFPAGKPSGVPIISITGTNGKTTVTRMIAHTLGLDGTVTGMASTGGIYVGSECTLKGDNTGPVSARRILRDTRVEVAVLETARGGLIRHGLGYDLADVGVLINIGDDHLGIDGINTMQELAKVKSLVIEAIKPGGTAVLNADDKMTPWLLNRVCCNSLLFSSRFGNLLLQKEINEGNRVVYVRDGSIYTLLNNTETLIAPIEEIPITFNGMAACNVENTLAAVSSLLALKISVDTIRAGIMSFKPDAASNLGRLNVHDMGQFSVMLDYGHNIAAYSAVADTIRGFDAAGYTGVIGMPGDRRDESIHEVGRICGQCFSKIYIKEDKDLRGRNAGDVAGLLFNAAVEEGVSVDNISVIYSESKAIETAIMEAGPGELVVLFCEEPEQALEIIVKCKTMLAQRDRSKMSAGNKKSAAKLQETAVG